VDKTTRFSKCRFTALFSNDAARREVEVGEGGDRHRGHFHADSQGHPESFPHPRDAGGVLELDQDPNLVDLAVPEDLDLELLDRRKSPDDPFDGRREHVDATDDQHVVEPPENTALQAPEGAAAQTTSLALLHMIAGPVADDRGAGP